MFAIGEAAAASAGVASFDASGVSGGDHGRASGSGQAAEREPTTPPQGQASGRARHWVVHLPTASRQSHRANTAREARRGYSAGASASPRASSPTRCVRATHQPQALAPQWWGKARLGVSSTRFRHFVLSQFIEWGSAAMHVSTPSR